MTKNILIFLMISLWTLPPAMADGDALETLRTKIDEGVRILDDPELASMDRRAEKEEKLWRLSEQLFDYPVMARLVLGDYWNQLTPWQQEAFSDAFTGFLRRAYVPRLMERYSGQRINYDRQQVLSPSKAVVEAHVLWNARKYGFNVHMIRRQAGWKIYDISVLGVSAIKNYRVQFRWLLMSGTLDQLIARLNSRGFPAS